MKTKSNKVREESEKYESKILKLLKERKGNDQAHRFNEAAWENENDIQYSAANLEDNLEKGIRELKQALHDLKIGNTVCLSVYSGGILQNVNHKIDSEVVKLQTLIKARLFYGILLK